MSDIGYPRKVYSHIRYNVGLCAFQSDIRRSDIKLSPISLITDIGLSAHLCCSHKYINQFQCAYPAVRDPASLILLAVAYSPAVYT
jgi:hypothetical protein